MEAISTYVIKSAGILIFLFLTYYFLLRKETFFNGNRWFLLFGLLLSLLLPLVTFTKIQWVETTSHEIDLNQFEVAIAKSAATNPETPEINWLLVAGIVYGAGLLFFVAQFIIDYADLRKTLKGKKIIQANAFKLIETSENISPFSYFNYIVYNPDLYDRIELANILEHEKVHCRQLHSVDVLVSRIYCIVFWFNPFAWLYKKTIIQNLEFIADSEAQQKISDRLSYQITLLKVTAHENCVAITNHFYQSLIKKRIIMLNKNQSRRRNVLKYGIVLPAVAAFMLYYQVEIVAQEKQVPSTETHVASATYSEDSNAKINAFAIMPSTTDAELKSYEKILKKQYSMEMKFSNIIRNKKKEILRFDFWFDDKVNKPQTLNVSKEKPENLFFLIEIKKDKSGKDILKVISYDKYKETGQSYKIEGESIHWVDNDSPKAEKSSKKPLIIDKNGKEIVFDRNEYDLIVDGYITSLSSEDAVKKYGGKAKDGALIISGDYQLVKSGEFAKDAAEGRAATLADGQISKIVTLENGDEVVFMKGGKVKIPGIATITLDKGAELIIDGKKYPNAKETLENMDLDRVKSVHINENWDEKDKKTVQLVLKLK